VVKSAFRENIGKLAHTQGFVVLSAIVL